MAKRLQNDKINKDDHKGVGDAAKGVKAGVGIAGFIAVAAPIVKKFGKPALMAAKKIIFK